MRLQCLPTPRVYVKELLVKDFGHVSSQQIKSGLFKHVPDSHHLGTLYHSYVNCTNSVTNGSRRKTGFMLKGSSGGHPGAIQPISLPCLPDDH